MRKAKANLLGMEQKQQSNKNKSQMKLIHENIFISNGV